ncbi:hypothetical protein [Aeoliella sp.]|uniref:hypothetical protein n=1 Tax=Aeoliella sp. TaxID=2795800 RepID=UPI003CCB8823
MPSIVKTPPELRLANLGHDRDTGELLIVNLPKYVCPECDALTPFAIGEASLSETDRKALDAVSGEVKPYETEHSDFYCRVCGRAVRVVCRVHEFAMSAYKYHPTLVWEMATDGSVDR